MSLTSVPFDNHCLKDSELALLRKGNFKTIADLLLTSIQDIAKRCKASPVEIKRIVDVVLAAIPPVELCRLDDLSSESDEKFSTGDAILDNALGGGIRTGMIWEIVGESAAGKTQLALQLSLAVQVPLELGGLHGSACYITTSAQLPTERLLQISLADEVLSYSGLEQVHTMAVRTSAFLENVLSATLPTFIEQQAVTPNKRPVKLLIIDALGELFHSSSKTTNSTLFQRSKDITTISSLLHNIATTNKIAVVVLNEVIDRFDRPGNSHGEDRDLFYDYQSRWFNTAEFFGEGKKEATLGLAWANQVNARIMLSRTGRRKYFNHEDMPKRRRTNTFPENHKQEEEPVTSEEAQASLIRRLTVIFSSVSAPIAVDYIVTTKGIIALPDEIPATTSRRTQEVGATVKTILPGDGGAVESSDNDFFPRKEGEVVLSSGATQGENDDEDYLWSQADALSDVDWDAFEIKLSQATQEKNDIS